MKLTRKQAFEPSIEKWGMIVENNGSIQGLYLYKFKHLTNGCGLCEKYLHTSNSELIYCAKCPIRPDINNYDDTSDVGCAQLCHPWFKWCSNRTKKKSQAVLDLIKSKM